jgi:hypothetical protein
MLNEPVTRALHTTRRRCEQILSLQKGLLGFQTAFSAHKAHLTIPDQALTVNSIRREVATAC